ncbi:MAG: hypothetical protein ACOY0T_34070 [Myxococcota bacterium]
MRNGLAYVATLVALSGCSSEQKSDASGGAGGTSTAMGGAMAQAGASTTTMGGAPAQGGAATGGSAVSRGGTTAQGGASLAGGSAGKASSAGAGNGVCGALSGQLFDGSHPWNQKVSTTPLDAESAAIIQYLNTNHTASARFQIDGPSDEPNSPYGIVVLQATASTPRRAFTPTSEFYEPDCDPAPALLPAGGAIEGESGYACEGDGDCHLIVLDAANCRLYEMWRANLSGSTFYGGCQAVWDLRQTYTPTLRGDCCTSADAAGLPIAAHLFNADEIAAGEIKHAIRFILPNEHMRSRVYVRPATHSTSATSGPATAPPYGARLRLKAAFDDSRLSAGAKVVARALKEYGMILSDGGNVTFTAESDRFTTAKWPQVQLGARDLTSLRWTDFEVVELGTRYTFNSACDCSRTPISQ